MRIIQITDIHINKIGEETYGIDIRKNFQEVLKVILKHEPDLLVISGDLCLFTPDISIYEWIHEQLKDYPIPLELMVGNHDDLEMIQTVFPSIKKDIKEHQSLYYTRTYGDENVIFLDSGRGEIAESQLLWLQKELGDHPESKVLFIHYPPFLAGVHFMDNKYPLLTRDGIQKILLAHQHPISIFTGHYHVEKTLRRKNIDQNITPSTYYQLDSAVPHFQVHSKKRGYRMIDILEEEVRSMVFYY